PFVYTVTTPNDSGTRSLRKAITDANSMGGGTINFNIPGSGVHTISPLTVLPTITQTVTIDGYSQPGSSANTNPPTQSLNTVLTIELSGALGGNFPGLIINASNCTVRGLVINSFQHDAIETDLNGNAIDGNFIGTDITGTIAIANPNVGVNMQGTNNLIGGLTTTPGTPPGNLISGNTGNTGVVLFTSAAQGHVIQGNIIGADITGTQPLGNTGGI